MPIFRLEAMTTGINTATMAVLLTNGAITARTPNKVNKKVVGVLLLGQN